VLFPSVPGLGVGNDAPLPDCDLTPAAAHESVLPDVFGNEV
jgi:hypothetical protein